MTTHRTYGRTRDCGGCRYWSEMIAFAHGGGPLQALCLGPDGQAPRGEYRSARQTCAAWASGHLGAVDEPGQEPGTYANESVSCPPTEHS